MAGKAERGQHRGHDFQPHPHRRRRSVARRGAAGRRQAAGRVLLLHEDLCDGRCAASPAQFFRCRQSQSRGKQHRCLNRHGDHRKRQPYHWRLHWYRRERNGHYQPQYSRVAFFAIRSTHRALECRWQQRHQLPNRGAGRRLGLRCPDRCAYLHSALRRRQDFGGRQLPVRGRQAHQQSGAPECRRYHRRHFQDDRGWDRGNGFAHRRWRHGDRRQIQQDQQGPPGFRPGQAQGQRHSRQRLQPPGQTQVSQGDQGHVRPEQDAAGGDGDRDL